MNWLKRIAKKRAAKIGIAILAAAIAAYLGVSEETANEIAQAIVGLF